jgi:hypothetical protein
LDRLYHANVTISCSSDYRSAVVSPLPDRSSALENKN